MKNPDSIHEWATVGRAQERVARHKTYYNANAERERKWNLKETRLYTSR